MPANIFPCLPPAPIPKPDHAALLAQARWAANINAKLVPVYIREYLDVHKKLAALRDACGYRFFVANTLAENRLLEKDVGDGLRKCLVEVMGLQREMRKWKKLAEKMEREEKRLHWECMRLFR